MDPDLYPDGSGSVVNTLPVQKIIDKLEDTGVCVKIFPFCIKLGHLYCFISINNFFYISAVVKNNFKCSGMVKIIAVSRSVPNKYGSETLLAGIVEIIL